VPQRAPAEVLPCCRPCKPSALALAPALPNRPAAIKLLARQCRQRRRRQTAHQPGCCPPAGKFYTLTTGSNEKRWGKMKEKLNTTTKSFSFIN
jgi:hypothetical protein